MGTPCYIPVENWIDLGSRGYTCPHIGVRSLHHQLLPTSRPGSPRQQSSSHQGLQLPACLWSHPRPSAQVVRVAPTMAWDAAPTHPLQSTQTLLPPRSLPVPRGWRVSSRGLSGLMALTSMAIPLPHLPSQLDVNGKMSTWRAATHSTQLFPSAPVPLMASAVQRDPTVMEPSFCLPPSPQLPWALAVPDSGKLCLMKVGT